VKPCTRCGVVKPLFDYYKDKRASDGAASNCKECHKVSLKSWAERNRAKSAAITRAYRKRHPERAKECYKAWREKNRAKVSRLSCLYAKRHPERVNALIAARKARKLKATPLWADLDAIKRIYAEARRLGVETGVKHHVDHIVPLQSDVVCGLHVQNNLRVLPAFDNLSKHNKLLPELL
jgi:hypothetical protein